MGRKRKVPKKKVEEIAFKKEDWICKANEAMTIYMVNDKRIMKKVDDKVKLALKKKQGFRPEYTHQIFNIVEYDEDGEEITEKEEHKEKIFGYKDLQINLYFICSTLDVFVETSCSKRIQKYQNKSTIQLKKPIQSLFEDPVSTWDDNELPPIIQRPYKSKFAFLKKLNSEFEPIGEVIDEYKVNGRKFVVSLSNIEDDLAREYHERAQVFSLFLIETMSYINDEDENWNIFWIFEKIKTTYSFVGYCTVYPFYAFPDKQRLRISQFIILPIYQRQGHGGKMLTTIYNYAKEKKYTEVTIEDQSTKLEGLRNKTDFKIFKEVVEKKKIFKNLKTFVWSKQLYTKLSKHLVFDKPQLRLIYEMYKFYKITELNDEEEERKFRLDLKRHYYLNYEMGTNVLDDEDRIADLQELYEKETGDFQKIIGKYLDKMDTTE